MTGNPAEEWQRLTEHYRGLYDEELRELAADFRNLTETAQQALRSEMSSRNLADPATPPSKADPAAGLHWASSVNPDADADHFSAGPFNPGPFRARRPDAGPSSAEEFDGPRDYTWKTPLVDCETLEQALLLREALRRAGIESWVEAPNARAIEVLGVRVLVAADQLEQAIEIARQPIPQEIVEEFETEVPEFVLPRCPQCGAEDPVLESAEPSNSWLCENCGRQWSDPIPEAG